MQLPSRLTWACAGSFRTSKQQKRQTNKNKPTSPTKATNGGQHRRGCFAQIREPEGCGVQLLVRSEASRSRLQGSLRNIHEKRVHVVEGRKEPRGSFVPAPKPAGQVHARDKNRNGRQDGLHPRVLREVSEQEGSKVEGSISIGVQSIDAEAHPSEHNQKEERGGGEGGYLLKEIERTQEKNKRVYYFFWKRRRKLVS